MLGSVSRGLSESGSSQQGSGHFRSGLFFPIGEAAAQAVEENQFLPFGSNRNSEGGGLHSRTSKQLTKSDDPIKVNPKAWTVAGLHFSAEEAGAVAAFRPPFQSGPHSALGFHPWRDLSSGETFSVYGKALAIQRPSQAQSVESRGEAEPF